MSNRRVGASVALVDDLLAGNQQWLETGWKPAYGSLGAQPAKRLAIIACMDCRNPVEQLLGLAPGDAKVIRNAGNHLDDGAMRSLVVAVYKLGVEHVAVMGHTDCGMTQIANSGEAIASEMAKRATVAVDDVDASELEHWLGPIADVGQHVRHVVEQVRAHRYMPKDLDVFGLLFDNKAGRVSSVG